MSNCSSTSKFDNNVAQRLDIETRVGDTLSMVINVTDENNDAIDLSSHTFKMEVRTEYGNTDSPVIADTDITITGTSGGVLTVGIADTIMAAIDEGTYVYDLEIVADSVKTTWLEGEFVVTPHVTI